jgi:hypothetical protein
MYRHLFVVSWSMALCLVAACDGGLIGSQPDVAGGRESKGGEGGVGGSTAGGGGQEAITFDPDDQCEGLQCHQVACSGAPTTLAGVVYAPDGKTPLYNVAVYVPNAELPPLFVGATCDKCGVLAGDPLVVALTDTSGRFVLENVPANTPVPLVLQVGKWRRLVTLPPIEPCTITEVSDPETTRLPRNTGEGQLPRIALTTGGADPLECLLRKIGIDDQEFSTKGGEGRVHLYQGVSGSGEYVGGIAGGAKFAPAIELWSHLPVLLQYDVVLLACEGAQNKAEKPAEALQAVFDYTALGGRLFASHWNNYFFEYGPPPFPSAADFSHEPDLPSPVDAKIDTTFPKGQAMSEWLLAVGASDVEGEIQIHAAQHTVLSDNPPISRQWIYQPDHGSVQYLTFNTPIGIPEEQQCGRVVFSDIHVSSGDTVGLKFPEGCTTTELSPQEKALLFMLFDLSACVLPDDVPPAEPL